MSKNDHHQIDYEGHTRPNMFSRAIRLIVIGVIIVVFLALALTSAPKNQDLNSIRDERTILGNKNAKNHIAFSWNYLSFFSSFIIYYIHSS